MTPLTPLSSRLKAEAEQQKKEDEKARREYIRNEFLRKKQLKLMVDMNDVIKPRSGSLKKKPRPKSIHRDVLDSSTPPARATGRRHKLHGHRRAVSVFQQPLTCSSCAALCCRRASSWLLGVECFPGVSQPG